MSQKNDKAYIESPFEYLPHQSETIVQNWYKARAYVLYLLNHTLEVSQYLPACWHFIVKGDSELMLSVVRHLALYSHFVNYEECDKQGNLSCKNRTIITLVSQKNAADIEAELKKKEFLCNLPDYCKLSLYGKTKNEDSYIDIALEVVNEAKDVHLLSSTKLVTITEEDVQKWLASCGLDDIYHIDTRKAIYANKSYDLGAEIKNIPYEDINCADRYFKAIDTFLNTTFNLDANTTLITSAWGNDIYKVKCGLSNIYCADCFEIREKEIRFLAQQDNNPPKNKLQAFIGGLLCIQKKRERKALRNHVVELGCCEHNRWVVERLILGYRPLSKKEKFEYEHRFADQRENYLSQLKKDVNTPRHIDICSNTELRRVDPDNMRYDSFLMLAIPLILEKVR